METYKNNTEEVVYFIAFTDQTKPVFGTISQGNQTSTGQSYLEIFNTIVELSHRLGELTGDVDYYEKRQNGIDETPYTDEQEAALLLVYRGTLRASPWQLRKSLNKSGLRDSVEDIIAGSDQDSKDGWEYASYFDRLNPLVIGLGQALSLTDSQLDGVFVVAMTL
jgi:hypothetical protein